ncbi:MAG: hypothetical protein HC804_00185 [Anaerolineae bacterium]|nr:hypothetical protein [Anaerolineae bacterium]
MSLMMRILGRAEEPQASAAQASAWTEPAWWGGLGDSVAGVSVGPERR